MRVMIKYLFLINILLISSCGNIKKVDTTAVKEQMNNRKIVKLSNEDIVSQADILGKNIASKLSSTVYKNCIVTIDSSMGEVKIFSLVELKAFKFKESKEKEMAEAFAYGLEHNEKLSGNIQKLDDSTYLYVFPIKDSASLNIECSKAVGFVYLSKQSVIKSISR